MLPYLVLISLVALALTQLRRGHHSAPTTHRVVPTSSAYQAQKHFGESECELVSSRGLMQLCDYYPERPVSSNKACWISNALAATLPRGARVYVPTSALGDFSARVLPKLRHPIRLVTGDADETVKDEAPYRAIADSPKIMQWHAQNLAMTHAKCAPLPIGVDLHSQAAMVLWGAKTTLSPSQQELVLKQTRAQAKLWSQRALQAYCNFQFNTSGGYYTYDRRDAAAQLDRSLVVWPDKPVARDIAWAEMAKCKFVVSPHGHGLDCHRTWEAMCLGCVPIVKSSPLDDFYRRLPVLIVPEWSALTLEVMRAFADKLEACPSTHPMLKLSTWKTILFVDK